MSDQKSLAIAPSEAKTLFADLHAVPVIALAVSGGPDSTALMLLAARWRDSLKTKPKLVAVTVDHGLRKESKGEATAVARLARKLNVAHRTVRWNGRKPATGVQEKARAARYRLLGEAAHKAGVAFGAVHWGYATIEALRAQDCATEFVTPADLHRIAP